MAMVPLRSATRDTLSSAAASRARHPRAWLSGLLRRTDYSIRKLSIVEVVNDDSLPSTPTTSMASFLPETFTWVTW